MAVKIRRSYKGAATAAVLDSGVSSAVQTSIALTTSPSDWPTGKFFVVVAPGTAQEEKMCVTLSGSTLTVVSPSSISTSPDKDGRGIDDTTARTLIAGGSTVYPVFTAIDANEANELTSTYANQGGIVYQGSSTFTQLAIGSAGQVLKVNSTALAPEWGQVGTLGIADDAVNLDKLAEVVLNKLVPVGTITAYAGNTAPTGWLLCDGTTSTSSYPTLAALVGATTPDLKGHVLVGKGSAPFDGALLSKFGSTTSTALHTHANTATFTGTAVNSGAMSQNAIHNHTQNAHAHDIAVANAGGFTGIIGSDGHGGTQRDTVASASNTATNNATNTDHTHTVTAAGTVTVTNVESSVGVAHGNVQPSALVNFIIKHD